LVLFIDYKKIPKYQISQKFVRWEPSCSMRTDRCTDRHHDANSRFPRFGEHIKNDNVQNKIHLCSISFTCKPASLLITSLLHDATTL